MPTNAVRIDNILRVTVRRAGENVAGGRFSKSHTSGVEMCSILLKMSRFSMYQ